MQEKKRRPLARSDFERWLKTNRSHLRAYRDPRTEKVGFYNQAEGIAKSFKGFDTWEDAKKYLGSAS